MFFFDVPDLRIELLGFISDEDLITKLNTASKSVKAFVVRELFKRNTSIALQFQQRYLHLHGIFPLPQSDSSTALLQLMRSFLAKKIVYDAPVELFFFKYLLKYGNEINHSPQAKLLIKLLATNFKLGGNLWQLNGVDGWGRLKSYFEGDDEIECIEACNIALQYLVRCKVLPIAKDMEESLKTLLYKESFFGNSAQFCMFAYKMEQEYSSRGGEISQRLRDVVRQKNSRAVGVEQSSQFNVIQFYELGIEAIIKDKLKEDTSVDVDQTTSLESEEWKRIINVLNGEDESEKNQAYKFGRAYLSRVPMPEGMWEVIKNWLKREDLELRGFAYEVAAIYLQQCETMPQDTLKIIKPMLEEADVKYKACLAMQVFLNRCKRMPQEAWGIIKTLLNQYVCDVESYSQQINKIVCEMAFEYFMRVSDADADKEQQQILVTDLLSQFNYNYPYNRTEALTRLLLNIFTLKEFPDELIVNLVEGFDQVKRDSVMEKIMHEELGSLCPSTAYIKPSGCG